MTHWSSADSTPLPPTTVTDDYVTIPFTGKLLASAQITLNDLEENATVRFWFEICHSKLLSPRSAASGGHADERHKETIGIYQFVPIGTKYGSWLCALTLTIWENWCGWVASWSTTTWILIWKVQYLWHGDCRKLAAADVRALAESISARRDGRGAAAPLRGDGSARNYAVDKWHYARALAARCISGKWAPYPLHELCLLSSNLNI